MGERQESRRPSWTVLGVFDPGGTGQDFAYTDGLAARGLPELHLTARPTHGDDPGSDWMLSMSDRGSFLNELAFDVLDGKLHPGDEFERLVDGGRTRMAFSVRGPVSPAEVDAHQLDEDTVVWSLRWSLHREPVGAPRPVEAPRRTELRELAVRLGSAFAPAVLAEPLSDSLLDDVRALAETAVDRSEPDASEWAGESWDVGQDVVDADLGPCLPLCLSSAGALLGLEGRVFDSWVYGSLALGAQAPLRSWYADIEAIARVAGRSEAVARVRTLVDDVMVEWVPEEQSGEEARAFEQFCRMNLNLLFAAGVVADQLSTERLAALFGPLLLATGVGVPAAWAAPADALRDALAATEVADLRVAVDRVGELLNSGDADAVLEAAGVALAAGVPAVGAVEVLSRTAFEELADQLAGSRHDEGADLWAVGWLLLLLSAAAFDLTQDLRESWPAALRTVSW